MSWKLQEFDTRDAVHQYVYNEYVIQEHDVHKDLSHEDDLARHGIHEISPARESRASQEHVIYDHDCIPIQAPICTAPTTVNPCS